MQNANFFSFQLHFCALLIRFFLHIFFHSLSRRNFHFLFSLCSFFLYFFWILWTFLCSTLEIFPFDRHSLRALHIILILSLEIPTFVSAALYFLLLLLHTFINTFSIGFLWFPLLVQISIFFQAQISRFWNCFHFFQLAYIQDVWNLYFFSDISYNFFSSVSSRLSYVYIIFFFNFTSLLWTRKNKFFFLFFFFFLLSYISRIRNESSPFKRYFMNERAIQHRPIHV